MEDTDRRTASLLSIIRGAGFFGIGKIVANVLGFLTNLLLTQALGPAVFGVYTFARTIIDTLGSVTNLGADKATLRFVSVDSERQGAELGLSYLLATVGGIFGVVGVYLLAPTVTALSLDDPLLTFALRVLAVLMVLQALITITGNSFRAIDRPELDSLLKLVIRRAIVLLFLAVAFVLSLGFVGYLVAVLAAVAATAVVGLSILVSRTSLSPSLPTDSLDIRSYLRYSLPLAFKDAGSVLYTRVDILLVGGLLTASAVGYYQVAILLSAFLTLPLSAINQVFPTMISRLHSDGDYETMEAVYKTATRWVLSGILPAAAGLVVFRNSILSLFGPEFTVASDLLVLFTLGQLTSGLVGPSGYLLMMTDRQFVVTANQWVFALLNIALNVVLIDVLGLIGAALGTAAVLGAINLARVVEVYYFNGIHPFSRKMLKPLSASVVCCAIMIAVERVLDPLAALLVGGAVGSVMYLITLGALGLDEGDRQFIREFRG
jgi:O-antigen/teichoic acid export membrane protein